jgi:hypothetical protein
LKFLQQNLWNHEPKQIFPSRSCFSSGILSQKWKADWHKTFCWIMWSYPPYGSFTSLYDIWASLPSPLHTSSMLSHWIESEIFLLRAATSLKCLPSPYMSNSNAILKLTLIPH